MKNFEKHMNIKLSKKVMSFLQNTPVEELKQKAQRLAFQSTCPVAMVDDSPELRKNLKEAGELIKEFILFTNKNQ